MNPITESGRAPSTLNIVMAVCAIVLLAVCGAAAAAQVVLTGPAGSGSFGASVTVLPNGNFVVTDPGFDATGPTVSNVGAVYLYRPNGVLISTLRGSTANDQVGSGGVTVLSNGNYVVISLGWDNGAVVGAGAVSFGSALSGINGIVSNANSLVGSTASDQVGSNGVTALSNGNYVVGSSRWDNGAMAEAGAVSFGSGLSGISGVVSASNSLVGNTASDFVGGIVNALSNGNYVVRSYDWNNVGAVDAGAVTFGSGLSGISGVISVSNSLVGTTANDSVGSGTFAELSNGNYVVTSPSWDNGAAANAGAATFASGSTGITGAVSASNSLIGSTASDQVGSGGVTTLSNGNYLVTSPSWTNGAAFNAGAATFASGSTGIAGVVSASNSLVGTTANDAVGLRVTALSNGNYVVSSSEWNNGAAVDGGAVTFGLGLNGITGIVSASNSLIGPTAGDQVGRNGATALSNGNYVVISPIWNNGAAAVAGAATFASGSTGIAGIVSAGNSLVGTTAGDQVGNFGVTTLSNGNYVVRSSGWDNGGVVDAGAVTFGSGLSGITGSVSVSNSLVGTTGDDSVGTGVTALSNGNYVVRSSGWDNGAAVDVGAVTFALGLNGISGAVSAGNSLIGSTANDRVGISGVAALSNGNYMVRSQTWGNGAVANAGATTFGLGTVGIIGIVSPTNSMVGSTVNDRVGFSFAELSNGNYVVRSATWDNGLLVDAGAVTLGLAAGSVIGPITSQHSALGIAAGSGGTQVFAYDPFRNQLIVGQPFSNRVVLQRTGIASSTSMFAETPDPSVVGQLVTFTASVIATAISIPSDGKVTFRASSGETCTDTSPTVSGGNARFSCTFAFTAIGISNVIAEYTGSIKHTYSAGGAQSHSTLESNIFANGFE